MTDERLQQIIDEIWNDIPRDAGKVEFDRDRDHPGLNGNREGLIRLASELLLAAKQRVGYPGLDIEYLFAPHFEFGPSIRCVEIPQVPVRQRRGWRSALGKLGCLIVGVAAVICNCRVRHHSSRHFSVAALSKEISTQYLGPVRCIASLRGSV